MNRRTLALLPALAAIAIGCSSEPAPKPDNGNAPQVQYEMVPANTGGTGGAPAPTTQAPATSTRGNPPSPGSD